MLPGGLSVPLSRRTFVSRRLSQPRLSAPIPLCIATAHGILTHCLRSVYRMFMTAQRAIHGSAVFWLPVFRQKKEKLRIMFRYLLARNVMRLIWFFCEPDVSETSLAKQVREGRSLTCRESRRRLLNYSGAFDFQIKYPRCKVISLNDSKLN